MQGPLQDAEVHVHDVLMFSCVQGSRETQANIYEGKPRAPGDYLEFFAEIDLLGALSACPAGLFQRTFQ